MRRSFVVVSIILVFGLFGCVQNNNSDKNINDKVTNESKQVDDYKVSIHVEKDLNIYATITFIGEAAKKDIYHGGSIFFFNVYEQNGHLTYEGAMNQPLLTTTLIRNEPHRVNFQGIQQLELKPGTYEFEAIANFSLNSDDILGTKIEIPVSKLVEIK